MRACTLYISKTTAAAVTAHLICAFLCVFFVCVLQMQTADNVADELPNAASRYPVFVSLFGAKALT